MLADPQKQRESERECDYIHSATTLGTIIKRKDPRVATERSERLHGLE